MSVQQQEKTHGSHRRDAYQPNSSNTSSRVRLRSCLRGEIEDTECKIFSCILKTKLLKFKLFGISIVI
jgi:hypothetical protein